MISKHRTLLVAPLLLFLAGCVSDNTSPNAPPEPPKPPALIGDFAPLRVGNVWIYKGYVGYKNIWRVAHGGYQCSDSISYFAKTRTLTVLSRREVSDTLIFKYSIVDTTLTNADIVGIPNVSQEIDSVIQVSNGSIGPSPQYSGGIRHNYAYIRFFDAHSVWDTIATGDFQIKGLPYKTYTKDTNYFQSTGPVSKSITYGRNLGVTSYATYSNFMCAIYTENFDLFRFDPAANSTP